MKEYFAAAQIKSLSERMKAVGSISFSFFFQEKVWFGKVLVDLLGCCSVVEYWEKGRVEDMTKN